MGKNVKNKAAIYMSMDRIGGGGIQNALFSFFPFFFLFFSPFLLFSSFLVVAFGFSVDGVFYIKKKREKKKKTTKRK